MALPAFFAPLFAKAGGGLAAAGGGSKLAGLANVGQIAGGLGSIFGGFGARGMSRRAKRRGQAESLNQLRAFERAISATPEEEEIERQIIQEAQTPAEELSAREIEARRAILAPEVERAQRAGVGAIQRTGLRRSGFRLQAEREPVEAASRDIEAFRTQARELARQRQLERRQLARQVLEGQRQRRLAIHGPGGGTSQFAFSPERSQAPELFGGGLQSLLGAFGNIAQARKTSQAEARQGAFQQRFLDILDRQS